MTNLLKLSASTLPPQAQWRLARRPVGRPVFEDWQWVEGPAPELPAKGVLVDVLGISIDPAMRGWMNDGLSYVPPVALGEVMRAMGLGQVLASDDPAHPVGQWVSGLFGVQRLCALDAAQLARGALTPVDLALGRPSQWLNTLGMPGMTAYFAMHEVGKLRAGDTVLISAASGAVGQTAGQLAKLQGCRVVGIAGGAAKCDFVINTLGFDACIDHHAWAQHPKPQTAMREALKAHAPQGIDVYLDNVGGELLDAVLGRIRRGARIVVCGAISQYNEAQVRGPANYLALLVQRARMEGMVVFDHAARYPEAIAVLAEHLRQGQMHSREDVVLGLENFPDVLLQLFDGKNFDKLILETRANALQPATA